MARKASAKVMKSENGALSEKPKKAAKGKKTQPKLIVQSVLGGEITVDEIVARVHAATPQCEAIYIKPEDNKAYFIVDGVTGNIALW